MPPRETGNNRVLRGRQPRFGQRLPPNFTNSRDPASPEELAPTIIWKRGTLTNVPVSFVASVLPSLPVSGAGGLPGKGRPETQGATRGVAVRERQLDRSGRQAATRDWKLHMRPVIRIRPHRQKAIFPDSERVLLPPLITALNRGLKTAIPHSMRRKVLIPRWAPWQTSRPR
jgi:hypothetical protein